MEVQPAQKAALPIITFEHDVTVHLNGEDIRALHFPAGHTDGDAIIFFPKNNVVHMGDDFVLYGFPFIDVKVIPGHGQLSNLDDVRAYVRMLRDTTAAVQKALDAHKTV